MEPTSIIDWIASLEHLSGPLVGVLAAALYLIGLHRGWHVTGNRYREAAERAEDWRQRYLDIISGND